MRISEYMMRVCVCVLEWYFKLYICFIDKTLERPKRSLPSACIHSHTHIYKFAPHVLTPSTHVRSCSCSLSFFLLFILSIQYVCFFIYHFLCFDSIAFSISFVVLVFIVGGGGDGVFFASFLSLFSRLPIFLVFFSPIQSTRSSSGFVCLCV